MENVDTSLQDKSVDRFMYAPKSVDPFGKKVRPRCPVCEKRKGFWYATILKVAYVRNRGKWKKVGLFCEECGFFHRL